MTDQLCLYKIQPATGEMLLFQLSGTEAASEEAFEAWNYYSTPLPELPPESYPLSLPSLWLRNRAKRDGQFIRGWLAVTYIASRRHSFHFDILLPLIS